MTDPSLDDGDVARLRRVLEWTLTEPGWRRVLEALEMFRDPAQRGTARTALRLAGPTRTAARLSPEIAAPPREPAPSAVHELVNQLVDSLAVPPSTRKEQESDD